MKTEEVAKIIAELLLSEDVRVEITMKTDGKAEKVTILQGGVNEKVSFQQLLRKFNIPNHLIGYRYLLTALKMVYEDVTLLENVTKCLYPEVAKLHETTSTKVEHAIRHAIQKAYEKDKNDVRIDI